MRGRELPLRVLAPLVALVAALVRVALPSAAYETAADWNPLRRLVLPPLDRLKRGHGLGYAAYTIDGAEHAGYVEQSPTEVGEALAANGYTRMPLAALKRTADGRLEVASWAHRRALFAEEQTHVMLFEAPDGGTDVYAHQEANALAPQVAYEHYRGIGLDPTEGKYQVRRAFTIDLDRGDAHGE